MEHPLHRLPRGVHPRWASCENLDATPGAAISAGANFLVVGRPITQAPDPAAACAVILAEMAAAEK